MNLKSAMYTLLLFVIVAAPVYHLSGNITGHVVSEETASVEGEYSISPDFKVAITDPGSYDIISEQAHSLLADVWACELATPAYTLERCIRTRMNETWSIDSLSDEEQYFVDFIEEFMACAESEDNFCMCEIPVEEHVLGITSHKGTKFNMSNLEYIYPNATAELDTYPGDIIRSSDTNVSFTIKNKIISGASMAPLTVDPIFFYKIDDKMLMVPNVKQSRLNDLKYCYPKKKRTFVFCADSGKEVYALKDNVYDYHKLEYKFAIDFSDKIAPAPVGFQAQNVEDSSQSLLVRWDRAPEIDLDHYNVYVSPRSFVSVKDLEPVARSNDLSFTVNQYREQDISKPILDGISYYIAVVAVDRSDNHVMQVSPVVGVSEDNELP